MLTSYDFYHLFYEHGKETGLSRKRTFSQLFDFTLTLRDEMEKELALFLPELLKRYSLTELLSGLSQQSLDEEDVLHIMAWYLLNPDPRERPDVSRLLQFIDRTMSEGYMKPS